MRAQLGAGRARPPRLPRESSGSRKRLFPAHAQLAERARAEPRRRAGGRGEGREAAEVKLGGERDSVSEARAGEARRPPLLSAGERAERRDGAAAAGSVRELRAGERREPRGEEKPPGAPAWRERPGNAAAPAAAEEPDPDGAR